jgi:hypothetical protein
MEGGKVHKSSFNSFKNSTPPSTVSVNKCVNCANCG